MTANELTSHWLIVAASPAPTLYSGCVLALTGHQDALKLEGAAVNCFASQRFAMLNCLLMASISIAAMLQGINRK